MKAILTSLLAGLAASAAGGTAGIASGARFWLTVPNEHPPLRDVRISAGLIGKAHWEKDPLLRERRLDGSFPVRWWSWAETTVSFLPEYDGPLTLLLSGTWADDGHGGCQRQEILWEEVSGNGVTVRNGRFEHHANGKPDGWTSPWGPYPAKDQWPLALPKANESSHFAASWHNRPLEQVIQVRKGSAVSIRLRARAATPPGFVEPKVPGKNSPAHQAAATLKRGVNFGNGWEADRQWGLKFTPADVDQVADEGFDHIRVPVAFHRHFQASESGLEVSPTLLAELEPVLRRALERKLTVLLDWHHFDEFTSDPEKNLERFVSGWSCLARHFRDWPPQLFFELLNEPRDRLDTPSLAIVYQKTIAAIRVVDTRRIIVASPGRWGSADEIDLLRLPDGDDRIIVTFHCYEPFHFTHQGAGWVGLTDLRGVVYPGPPQAPLAVPDSLRNNPGVTAFLGAYNTLPAESNPCSPVAMRATLDHAVEWSRRFGRPVHLGEFGAFHAGDDASRSRYLRDVRRHAEDRGIPWTLWEWKSGFGYWDPRAGKARFRRELME